MVAVNTSNGRESSGALPARPTVLSSVSNPAHNLLTSLAPQLMSHRIIASNSFASSFASSFLDPNRRNPLNCSPALHFSKVVKLLLPPSLGGKGGVSLNNVLITDKQQIDALLKLDLPLHPSQQSSDSTISLLEGFQASSLEALQSKYNRQRRRAQIGQKLLGLEQSDGTTVCLKLKQKLDHDLGMMSSREPAQHNQRRVNSAGFNGKQNPLKRRKRPRPTDINGLSHAPGLVDQQPVEQSIQELQAELAEIVTDQKNLRIRKNLISRDLNDLDLKIFRLNQAKEGLEQSLLALREEELELLDEYEGVKDRLLEREPKGFEPTPNLATTTPAKPRLSAGIRRRRGPAFLPSEHEELPKNVAFMTLKGHTSSITALDFSAPYGYLVSASSDNSVRVWDLVAGETVQILEGHTGTVKCLQTDNSICITGGSDGQIRVWDLNKAYESDPHPARDPTDSISSDRATPVRDDSDPQLHHNIAAPKTDGPCAMKFQGHTKSVTALYFDESCLLTGSSDKTIRQWDLNTGQLVTTMDVLWAMQHQLPSPTVSSPPHHFSRSSSTINGFEFDSLGTLSAPVGECEDFISGIQFWGYALASGSGDGCVRMWDMRTGQTHRTLIGHTGPVTCLQFDETYLMSGSADKTIKIWDLRTGMITETIKYQHGISSLQFDSRKIVAAAGEPSINVYNRTTLQHLSINANGHTAPVEKLRYEDRYMVSGGKDCTLRVWSI